MTRLEHGIYSIHGGDPALGELVRLFVEEMPGRVEELSSAFGRNDMQALRSAAHQLKGAAGSYGFQPITQYAERLEQSLNDGTPPQEVEARLTELAEACNSVCAGPRP